MDFGSVLEANLGSKTDKMASKNEVQKMIEKRSPKIRPMSPCAVTFGAARRNARASWGDYRGVIKTRPKILGIILPAILCIKPWRPLTGDLTRRAPTLEGRAADF